MYEIFLELNDIEHRMTKVATSRTNGLVERLKRTVLDEFFRTAFRKKLFESLEALQEDFDRGNEKLKHVIYGTIALLLLVMTGCAITPPTLPPFQRESFQGIIEPKGELKKKDGDNHIWYLEYYLSMFKPYDKEKRAINIALSSFDIRRRIGWYATGYYIDNGTFADLNITFDELHAIIAFTQKSRTLRQSLTLMGYEHNLLVVNIKDVRNKIINISKAYRLEMVKLMKKGSDGIIEFRTFYNGDTVKALMPEKYERHDELVTFFKDVGDFVDSYNKKTEYMLKALGKGQIKERLVRLRAATFLLKEARYKEVMKITHSTYLTEVPEFYINLGRALACMGAFETAIKEFKTALKYQLNFSTAHYYLYKTYELMGDKEKARFHHQMAQRTANM